MKKIYFYLLLISMALSLLALKEGDIKFKFISSKEIDIPPTVIDDKPVTDYILERKFSDEFLVSGDGEEIMSYLVWKKNNIEVAKLPTYENNNDIPFLIFSNKIVFSTKSRMWIIPYEYDYEDDYEGDRLQNGIYFISEDGKTIIKDFKVPMGKDIGLLFNRGETLFKNSRGCYTDSDYFFCLNYFISVYGDISYTFPTDLEMHDIAFTKDGKYFRFHNRATDNNYYAVYNPELVYQGLAFLVKNFVVSNDRKICAVADKANAWIYIYIMDTSTHKPIYSFKGHYSRIYGIPNIKKTYKDENGEYTGTYFDIKLRFEEITNNLIIITDGNRETTVELIYDQK